MKETAFAIQFGNASFLGKGKQKVKNIRDAFLFDDIQTAIGIRDEIRATESKSDLDSFEAKVIQVTISY